MAKFYVMADIHGCLDVFVRALGAVEWAEGNRLFLLGDYIPHQKADEDGRAFVARSEEALRFVKALVERYPGQVVALMGNHEADLLDDVREGVLDVDRELVRWTRGLPLFHETEWQVFVHAGIDEEADDLWRWGTDEALFCRKYPAQTGRFCKDIVAGHVGTSSLRGERGRHDVFWDGESHYYIDGTTEESGVLPLLIFDADARRYTQRLATKEGLGPEDPVMADLRYAGSEEYSIW